MVGWSFGGGDTTSRRLGEHARNGPGRPSESAGYGVAMYEWRHRIGNFFAKIREYRAITMRMTKPTPVMRPASTPPPR